MATLFVDYENGNDNYGGTSFAPLASGTDGTISSIVSATYATFSSSSGNFPNDNTIAQTKNVAWYTNSLTSTGSLNNVTLVKTNITPPSGVDAIVYSMVENTSSSSHYLASVNNYTPIYTGTEYTLSAYFKANGRNKILIRYDADVRMARYNLSNGTVEATGASATSNITSVGDGWYRLSLTITTPAGTGYSAENWQIMLEEDSYVDLTFASATYVGNGISGVYICGLQIENSSSATSYEKPPEQSLSIFNGTSYISFYIAERINSTTLRINNIIGGTSLSTQSSRQYFIGGRWKTISTTGASAARLVPGDTIRVMGSPAPTPVSSGLWTGHRGGVSSNVSSTTNTSPITVNCASTMATLGISTGDIVTIAGHTTNTNANGTWVVTVANPSLGQCTLNGSTGNGVGGAAGFLKKRTNCVVQLNSPVTANIASYGNRGEGRTAWTGSTNVTATLDTTDTKEGDVGDSIAIAAAFSTGKAAYKSTGTLDLSAYQQISFYIKQTAGTVTIANDISLRLCSDTIGDVVVHTFNIEGLVSLNTWVPVTINLGSAMSSSIQSIALYVDTDRGTQTFLLSNIIACKAPSADDSLNLQSLIGKNTTDEPWFPIMSINGTRVVLGNYPAITPLSNPSNNDTYRGYDGTTENTLVYKRETIKTDMVTAATTQVFTIQEAGTAAASFNYEFGWDRSSMSTQNLESYFDGRNGNGYGLYNNTTLNVNINKLGMVRYYAGARFLNHFNSTLSLEYAIGCTLYGWDITGCRNNTFNYAYSCSNQYGIAANAGCGNNTFNKLISYSDMIAGIYISNCGNNIFNNFTSINTARNGLDIRDSTDNILSSGIIRDSSSYGAQILSGHNNTFINTTTTTNSSTSMYLGCGELYLKNCILNETSEFTFTSYNNSRIFSTNHDNTLNNILIFTDGGTITPQTFVRYSNIGYAWAMSPTSTTRASNYPLNFPIAKIAVSANSLVTVKAWMRRTNIGLTTGLRIKGGQIAGVPSDITSYMGAAADTWAQVTLTFTPTEVGVVEILAECYGGTTFTGYVDDISITQV
jgi:hypothetical protein